MNRVWTGEVAAPVACLPPLGTARSWEEAARSSSVGVCSPGIPRDEALDTGTARDPRTQAVEVHGHAQRGLHLDIDACCPRDGGLRRAEEERRPEEFAQGARRQELAPSVSIHHVPETPTHGVWEDVEHGEAPGIACHWGPQPDLVEAKARPGIAYVPESDRAKGKGRVGIVCHPRVPESSHAKGKARAGIEVRARGHVKGKGRVCVVLHAEENEAVDDTGRPTRLVPCGAHDQRRAKRRKGSLGGAGSPNASNGRLALWIEDEERPRSSADVASTAWGFPAMRPRCCMRCCL